MIFMRRENLDKDLEKKEGLVWRCRERPFCRGNGQGRNVKMCLVRFTRGD